MFTELPPGSPAFLYSNTLPTSSTRPPAKTAVGCPPRRPAMPPVVVHVPLAGSNSSADATSVEPFTPPATSTRPSPSRTATCAQRAEWRLLVDEEEPATSAEGVFGFGPSTASGRQPTVQSTSVAKIRARQQRGDVCKTAPRRNGEGSPSGAQGRGADPPHAPGTV